MPSPMPEDTNIFLGRFVKAFGLRGELKFVASEDFWADVLDSKRLELKWLEGEDVNTGPAHITRYRAHGTHFVVELKGVNSRTEAEASVGTELFVDVSRLDVDLPAGDRPFQLVGRSVRLESGRVLGTIRSVMFSAAHPVYVVEGTDGEVLVPAVDEFLVARDEETGDITIRPIPGLIDE